MPATKIVVNIPGETPYDVRIGATVLSGLGESVRRLDGVGQAPHLLVLTDSNVGPLYLEEAKSSLRAAGFRVSDIVVPAGEDSKSLAVAGEIWSAMASLGLTRDCAVVALGGGVVGDLGGFCAASYMRGIDFVNCPTTVLSQVDSSIGGKTAIDLGETKNIVGAFWQPKVVLVDFDTLKTLPRRQVVNGLAEALKTGIIGDPQLFALFECEHPEDNIEQIVYRSLKFKKKIVEQDEREGSVRACLNFGHTIGHGIEAVRGVRGRRTTGLYHGECVALGMLPMIEDTALLKRTRAIYRALGLPTRAGANKEKVLAYMQHDKKARGDHITVIKCPGLGCWRADSLPMTELPALLGME